MSQIVVDTDVASYIFNRHSSAWHSSARRYLSKFDDSELVLSFMTVAEMRAGALSAGWGFRRSTLLEQFIEDFGVVYPDDSLCTTWANLRANARFSSRALSPQDAWIAATGPGLDAPLATNNRRDFIGIPGLRLADH